MAWTVRSAVSAVLRLCEGDLSPVRVAVDIDVCLAHCEGR